MSGIACTSVLTPPASPTSFTSAGFSVDFFGSTGAHLTFSITTVKKTVTIRKWKRPFILKGRFENLYYKLNVFHLENFPNWFNGTNKWKCSLIKSSRLSEWQNYTSALETLRKANTEKGSATFIWPIWTFRFGCRFQFPLLAVNCCISKKIDNSYNYVFVFYLIIHVIKNMQRSWVKIRYKRPSV